MKFVVVVLLAFVTVGLTACGDDATASPTPTAAASTPIAIREVEQELDKEALLRKVGQNVAEAMANGEWALVFSYHPEQFKEKCTLGEFGIMMTFFWSIFGMPEDTSVIVDEVRIDGDLGWVDVSFEKDGQIINLEDAGEEREPDYEWRDGKWITYLLPEDLAQDNLCSLDYGTEPPIPDHGLTLGGTDAFLGRTYQGEILQLTLEQIVILDEVAYTEPIRTLIFQRGDEGEADALEGSFWTLEYLGESFAPAQPIPGTDLTLEFMDDGALRGDAGCNSYFSHDYIAAGGIFSAGAVGYTEMACEAPDGVMEQEARFLKLLGAAVTYTVSEDTLTLTVPVRDHVIRSSSEDNVLMVIRTRIGNHSATRVQLDIEALPPELRMDTGRYKSVNTFATGTPTEGFHAKKNIYIPIIRGPHSVERGFELDGWIIFDVPKGSQVESFKWEAGEEIVIDME